MAKYNAMANPSIYNEIKRKAENAKSTLGENERKKWLAS